MHVAGPGTSSATNPICRISRDASQHVGLNEARSFEMLADLRNLLTIATVIDKGLNEVEQGQGYRSVGWAWHSPFTHMAELGGPTLK